MLTDLPTVKALLSIATTTQDALLLALLPAADAAVKEYCGRQFEKASRIEYYTSTGTKQLPLRERPVWTINNVWFDYNGAFGYGQPTAFDSTTLLTQGIDYVLQYDWTQADGTQLSKCGVLTRLRTVWAEVGRVYFPGKLTADQEIAVGNIKVDYTAGYDPVPDDLQFAVVSTLAYMKRTVKLGQAMTMERIGEYAYKIAPTLMATVPELGSTRQILSRYKNVAF